MSTESAIALDLTEMLANQNITDVEDLPELMTLPNGRYMLKGISFKAGESSKKNPKVGITLEVVEVLELSQREIDAGVTPEAIPEGAMTHFIFADKELPKVLSRLKKPFGDTMVENNIGNFGELADQFDQLTFVCEVARRPGPDHSEDDPQWFGELVLAAIA